MLSPQFKQVSFVILIRIVVDHFNKPGIKTPDLGLQFGSSTTFAMLTAELGRY